LERHGPLCFLGNAGATVSRSNLTHRCSTDFTIRLVRKIVPALITLTDIVKNYRSMRALNGVTLQINPGITGLLGPNGAGKSTLIKLILGLVKITSGSGTILGYPLGTNGRQIRDRVGYMPEDDCYIPGMSGIEVVQFSACLAGLPQIEALRRAHEILDFCGMKQERYRTIETYSTGMRQKTKFAAAIVHDPDFLIFDEPTSGLDPEEREALLNRIRLLSQQAGKSVIISTHILPDVQAICDDVLILSQGRVLLSDRLETLNRPTAPTVTIRILGEADAMMTELQRRDCTATLTLDRRIVVESQRSQPDDLVAIIWDAARQTHSNIQSLTPARNSLEEIFLETVREATHASS
jgi:ABC-2 type transport system ATP-binding protein